LSVSSKGGASFLQIDNVRNYILEDQRRRHPSGVKPAPVEWPKRSNPAAV
jgi:hypothetical protein